MTHHELTEILLSAGAPADSAELHGGLCGSLCAGGLSASQTWLDEWLSASAAPELIGDVRAALNELELRTWQSLSGSGYLLDPLLPDDDEPLDARVDALAAWCHGFLAGLGTAGFGLSSDTFAGEQVDEVVRDFAEIGRAGVDSDSDADRNAAGFRLAELVEYIRAGTQIVFESLAPMRERDAQNSIH